jgi:hypothetical protein
MPPMLYSEIQNYNVGEVTKWKCLPDIWIKLMRYILIFNAIVIHPWWGKNATISVVDIYTFIPSLEQYDLNWIFFYK